MASQNKGIAKNDKGDDALTDVDADEVPPPRTDPETSRRGQGSKMAGSDQLSVVNEVRPDVGPTPLGQDATVFGKHALDGKMFGSGVRHGQPRAPLFRSIAQEQGAGSDGQRQNFKRKPKRPQRPEGFKAFYEAVARGDLNVVKEMLKMNNELMETKFTLLEENALQVAVVARQKNIVDHLLRQPTDKKFLEHKNNFGDTALTLAAATGSTAIVRLLVDKCEEQVDIMNGKGQLAIVVAAIHGHEEIVRYLYGFTLVESLFVHDETVGYRYNSLVESLKDSMEDQNSNTVQAQKEDQHSNTVQAREKEAVGDACVRKEDQNLNTVQAPEKKPVGDADANQEEYSSKHNGFLLFKGCIIAEIYDIALKAFEEGPNQCIEELQKEKGKTLCSLALADFGTARINGFLPWLHHNVSSMIVQWGFVKKYRSHDETARRLLRKICEKLPDSNLAILGKATFIAVLHGNVDFLKTVIEECPDVIWLEFEGLSIFGHAISKGLKDIYIYVCKRTEISLVASMIADSKGNTLLHHAAQFSPSHQHSQFRGPALQMQRELQRFKEVEKATPMCSKLMNKCNQTPKDLFNKAHMDLKNEARDWLKEIAKSCSVVATLIVTIMFTAAFTVPGADIDDTGSRTKLGSKHFTVYIISDALSLLFSCTSAMIFLGIHTSLFREEDFLTKLPLALMFGLLTLFLSIATMMVAFGIALVIMLQERFMWISLPMLMLGSIPVSIYAILHIKIFIDVFHSTFRGHAK